MLNLMDRDITYTHRKSDFTQDVSVGGVWVASATCYHAGEEVADEVRYHQFLDGDCATATELDAVCSTCGGDGDCPDCSPIVADSPGLCACGTPATLVVRLGGLSDYVCDVCFQGNYENNYEDSRAWVVEPLTADPPDGPSIPIIEAPDETPPEYAFPICIACHTNAYPPSSRLSGACMACANAWYFGLGNRFAATQYAQTLQSRAIEARIKRCVNCDGPHFTWACPEVRTHLFAEDTAWKDIALGRELCRMRWRDFAAFVALLLSVPAEHLGIYAASYVAFIRDHNERSDLTTSHVLRTWGRIISERGGSGPAAPAMQRAA